MTNKTALTLTQAYGKQLSGTWPTQWYISIGLYSWGMNGNGDLGLGDTTNRSSPTQISAYTTWSQISGGNAYSAVIKTDGTLWSWGYNFNFGSLGLGDTTNRSSPVQVGALTTWSKVSAGRLACFAIKTDGTLWGWGIGNYGGLGQGNTISRSSPVQIGALTTWSKASAFDHTAAIKTDGTLWSWGQNNYGQLGIGIAGNYQGRSSPVQIGALSTWSKISAGTYHSMAIKTDGTMWSWGYNIGQLGLGDTIRRSSPVQVGALTTWLNVSAGKYYSAAIKTDGTLWAWGRNYVGQLGLGNTANTSSPVQIGALTTWASISAGLGNFSYATSN